MGETIMKTLLNLFASPYALLILVVVGCILCTAIGLVLWAYGMLTGAILFILVLTFEAVITRVIGPKLFEEYPQLMLLFVVLPFAGLVGGILVERAGVFYVVPVGPEVASPPLFAETLPELGANTGALVFITLLLLLTVGLVAGRKE